MEASSYMAALSYGDPKPIRRAYIAVKLLVSHKPQVKRGHGAGDIHRQTRLF